MFGLKSLSLLRSGIQIDVSDVVKKNFLVQTTVSLHTNVCHAVESDFSIRFRAQLPFSGGEVPHHNSHKYLLRGDLRIFYPMKF
jgi:hypothetical protein